VAESPSKPQCTGGRVTQHATARHHIKLQLGTKLIKPQLGTQHIKQKLGIEQIKLQLGIE
jgi:hypothetical protein